MAREDIRQHEGCKYIRLIGSCNPGEPITHVDVYEVLIAFNVTDPAIQHCVKKLLCTGIRGKGSYLEDLKGAMAALNRAIDIAEREQVNISKTLGPLKDNPKSFEESR